MAVLHNSWLGKREGPNFRSSYNSWGFKPGISGPALGELRGHGIALREGRADSADPRRGNSHLKHTPAHAGRLLARFRVCPGEAAFSERPLWGQRTGGRCHFPAAWLRVSTEPPAGTGAVPTLAT